MPTHDNKRKHPSTRTCSFALNKCIHHVRSVRQRAHAFPSCRFPLRSQTAQRLSAVLHALNAFPALQTCFSSLLASLRTRTRSAMDRETPGRVQGYEGPGPRPSSPPPLPRQASAVGAFEPPRAKRRVEDASRIAARWEIRDLRRLQPSKIRNAVGSDHCATVTASRHAQQRL